MNHPNSGTSPHPSLRLFLEVVAAVVVRDPTFIQPLHLLQYLGEFFTFPSLADAMTRAFAVILSFLLLSSAVRPSEAHEHDGDAEAAGSCESNPDIHFAVDFLPGVVTVDGHVDEWADVEGSQFSLRPALDFDEDKAYAGGEITVKAVHDGANVFFMLQVDGDYAYALGESTKCPSVALMFQVGENATYQNMGGCPNLRDSCTAKNCRGHEVDIMHFSVGTATPGRLYGSNLVDNKNGNGNDSFGHLVDVYAWNPHCRYLDGLGPSGNYSNAQNDWQGAWWHSSLSFHSGFVQEDSPYGNGGEKGTYFFEFSRPLRTMDRFQQDVQFTIGQPNKVAVAFWYPTDGKPWSGSQHYSASCDWLPMDVLSSSGVVVSRGSSSDSWDGAVAFSLLLSVVSICLSAFMWYWFSKPKTANFTRIGEEMM